MNVSVMPGIVIREGCVIGANALVTRSTEPNGLYLGVPARRVRDLPVGGDQAAGSGER
jgi:acetyltransferase-like isoleucine patch superfamily enzyme